MIQEEFDFDISKLQNPLLVNKPLPNITELYNTRAKQSWKDRRLDMLCQLHDLCITCSMCPLGEKPCEEKDTVFDPHVFSNMKPSKWMVVGQWPKYYDCLLHEPFIGDSGKNFEYQLKVNRMSRDDFYICNLVRCHTIGNASPTFEHKKTCSPFLRMEIEILRPKLVITLGAVALSAFRPDVSIGDVVGKIIRSDIYGVKVFPIYHPSPRNLISKERSDSFKKCMRLLCKLIKQTKV